MDPLTAGALGLTLGLALAALAVLLVRASQRQEAQEAPVTAPGTRVPDGVSAVLAVLRSSGIVLDQGARVLRASASAVAYGLVRQSDLTHAELYQLARQVQRDGTIRETELELARGPLGQGRIFVGVRVAPLGPDLVLILVDDRTQARRLEETRRDFVVNVSHELKTPVGGLALLAEAVGDAADDPVAVARFATRMKAETTRLTRLVSEIVDLSRLQTSDAFDEVDPVDVGACAEEAVDHTRLVAGARQLTATRTADPQNLAVYGDRDLITTAIRNLITNAINYSDDRSKVSVVTRRAGDLVEVAVSDQGRGISPQDQQRIFERFYRVDPARSRVTGGTGLGLSIVKHICENHGGEVVVWSQEGHGSTFTMRLPAAGPPDAAGAPSTQPAARHTLSTGAAGADSATPSSATDSATDSAPDHPTSPAHPPPEQPPPDRTQHEVTR